MSITIIITIYSITYYKSFENFKILITCLKIKISQTAYTGP